MINKEELLNLKKVSDYCFCTVVTPDYQTGAAALYLRLKYLESKYPVEIFACGKSKEEFDILNENNIPYRLVDCLEFKLEDRKRPYHKYSLNTIYPFTLVKYALVCYISADTLVCNNIDFIIDENLDLLKSDSPMRAFDNKCGMYNTLLMLMKPSMKHFEGLLSKAKQNTAYFDEMLYSQYFNSLNYYDSVVIPKHNLSSDRDKTGETPIITRGKIVHFPGCLKPWVGTSFNCLYENNFKNLNEYLDKYHDKIIVLSRLCNINYNLMAMSIDEMDCIESNSKTMTLKWIDDLKDEVIKINSN